MNGSMILYILGQVLKIEGVLMLPSVITGLIYQEQEGWAYLLGTGICLAVGQLMSWKKPRDTVFYLKDGCVATALCWILMSLFGGLPFLFTGEIPSFTDATFEMVSGFTTTGSSILTDVEALSHASLFWRSFSHWIGGMGILVFLLAIVPMSGGSTFNLMRAESPGPSVGKLVPKLRATARILYVIYFVMTLIQIVLLVLGGMPLFESILHTFGTAGTGGFGIKGDSLAGYSPLLQWIITVFMILFGVNFNAYFFLIFSKDKKAFLMEEVRWYFVIIFAAVAMIFWNTLSYYDTPFETLTHAAFQVGSIITTTGYATTDFNQWPMLSKCILMALMFLGACAGSTGGGIKVSRIVIMFKTFLREMNSHIHPKSVRQIKFEGKNLDSDLIRSICVYLATFMFLFVGSLLLISLENLDFMTTFSAVATCINNIGPGMELLGPTENFAFLSDFSKWVLIFDMLAGRLELFPMLILFHPGLWKEQFARRRMMKKIQ